jgi:hypothetical protein
MPFIKLAREQPLQDLIAFSIYIVFVSLGIPPTEARSKETAFGILVCPNGQRHQKVPLDRRKVMLTLLDMIIKIRTECRLRRSH